MKQFLRVLLAIVICIAIVFGTYWYTDSKNSNIENGNTDIVTVSKHPVTEKGSDRIFLNSLEQEGQKFELYRCGTDTILIHNGKEYVYYDWSKYITLEKPEMHYNDYDSNPDDKELAIKIVSSRNVETGEYIYDIYILNPFTDENGEPQIDLFVASKTDWNNIFTKDMNIELSQPSFCPKFVQVAMTYRWKESIKYDENGMADCIYKAYSHALKDGKGGYCKTQRWTFGQGAYTFTETENLRLEVDVKLIYDDTDEVQELGVLYYEVWLRDNNSLGCRPKTMGFKANPEYKSLNPKHTADKGWNYVETNTNQNPSTLGDTNIDQIKYKFDFSIDAESKSVSFDKNETEMKNISKMEFTEKGIKLYAKKGYAFSKLPANVGDFKVMINEDEPGNDYEIAYKASVSKQDDIEVLYIEFEHEYPKSYFHNVTIYYNVD